MGGPEPSLHRESTDSLISLEAWKLHPPLALTYNSDGVNHRWQKCVFGAGGFGAEVLPILRD